MLLLLIFRDARIQKVAESINERQGKRKSNIQARIDEKKKKVFLEISFHCCIIIIIIIIILFVTD